MVDLDKLSERLLEVRDAFKRLKKLGMDREILEIYLQNKTKLSRADISKMLDETEKFYERLAQEHVEKQI